MTVHLTGPTFNKNKINSIGIAAHIKAAAPGGARYDELTTSSERSDISNGIWLCTNCATMIDRDPDNYPVSLLQKWKVTAEEYADSQLGKVPLSKDRYESMENLIFKDLPKKKIPRAIADICQMTKEKFEAIDPRFSADVTFDGMRTAITLRCKETVSFTPIVKAPFVSEFREKYQALLDHGKDLIMPAEAVSIEGTKLFDFEGGFEGKITIGSLLRRPAVVKIHVLDSHRNIIFIFDDVNGEVVGGLKSATFSGKSLGGIFEIVCKFNVDTVEGSTSNFRMQTDFSLWESKGIRSLPYFEKLFNFYEQVTQKMTVQIVLEFEGEQIFKAISYRCSGFLENYRMLRYIRNVRLILSKLNRDFLFQNNYFISAIEAEHVEDTYHLLTELSRLKGKEIGSQKLTLTVGDTDEAVQAAYRIKSKKMQCIRLEFPDVARINLLGNIVQLPTVEVCYFDVSLHFRTKKMKAGQSIPVELRSYDTSTVSVKLL